VGRDISKVFTDLSKALLLIAISIKALHFAPTKTTVFVGVKRGKEKSPSGGHCQCEKVMNDPFTDVSTNF
jgi:hypothetical protein